MNIHDYLSDDGHVVMALCSNLAIPEGPSPEPFTLSEWNELEKLISNSSLKRPAALMNCSATELAASLTIPLQEAERVVGLIERSARLSIELESLFARGIWAVSRVDEAYPAKLRDTLKHHAPSILFGAGEIGLLKPAGIAIVGSRNIDETAAEFARKVGRRTVAAGLPVVSGGARGTDRIAMDGALEAEGVAIGALADSLEATMRKSDVAEFLADRSLVLLTPHSPNAGFSVGAAMGRNKIIYGLASYAVVVSSDYQTGGTWAGAVQALKAGWCPVFVRDFPDAPKGHRELMKLGAVPLTEANLAGIDDFAEWLRQHAKGRSSERELFDL